MQVGSLSETLQSLQMSQNLFIRIRHGLDLHHTHTIKAQNYLLRSVRLLNNSKMIYRMFKQYMTACSTHKVTSLRKHGSLNVCFSRCGPFEERERDVVRVQEPFPRYDVHSMTPYPPVLKLYWIPAYQNYASVVTEESYDPQYQVTKTRWISLVFYCRPTLIKKNNVGYSTLWCSGTTTERQ